MSNSAEKLQSTFLNVTSFARQLTEIIEEGSAPSAAIGKLPKKYQDMANVLRQKLGYEIDEEIFRSKRKIQRERLNKFRMNSICLSPIYCISMMK